MLYALGIISLNDTHFGSSDDNNRRTAAWFKFKSLFVTVHTIQIQWQ